LIGPRSTSRPWPHRRHKRGRGGVGRNNRWVVQYGRLAFGSMVPANVLLRVFPGSGYFCRRRGTIPVLQIVACEGGGWCWCGERGLLDRRERDMCEPSFIHLARHACMSRDTRGMTHISLYVIQRMSHGCSCVAVVLQLCCRE